MRASASPGRAHRLAPAAPAWRPRRAAARAARPAGTARRWRCPRRIAASSALRRLLPVALAAAALLAAAAAPAGAQELVRPPSVDRPPPGHRLTAVTVARIAAASPAVRRERARTPAARPDVLLRGARDWQVSYVDATGGRRREVAQVLVDDRTGRVTGAYTGFRVAWSMARGTDGAFGGAVNAPVVWVVLAVLWAALWLDPRRLRSWRTVDAAVLSALSVVYALLAAGEVEAGVTAASPLLLYLLVRLGAAGVRRAPGPAPAWLPLRAMAAALGVLLLGRLVLTVAGGNVIDVGRASLLGADRLLDGAAVYGAGGAGIAHPDTYGPLTYLLYAPFQALAPWDGEAAAPAAAVAAAQTWDWLAVAALAWLGHRLGGPRTALTLALAWAACPFTALALCSGSNDALVGLALALALLAALGRHGTADPMAAPATAATSGASAGATSATAAGASSATATRLAPGAMSVTAPDASSATAPGAASVTAAGASSATAPGLARGARSARASVGARGDALAGALRGAAAALAALTKLAPAAVAPALATHGLHGRRPSAWPVPLAAFAAAFAASCAALLALVAGDLGTFWDRTVAFQADRGSPFSLWGLHGWDAAQRVAQALAILVALGMALVPRRPGLPATAAVAGAALVATWLAVDHWFVLYVPWLVPPLAVALLAPEGGEM